MLNYRGNGNNIFNELLEFDQQNHFGEEIQLNGRFSFEGVPADPPSWRGATMADQAVRV